jgi:hypothetical protein
MRTKTLIVAVAVFLVPQFSFAADDAYTSLLSAANQLLKDGKLAESRQTATTATSLAPARFEAWFLAGAVAHQQRNDAEAKTLIEKALALAPEDRKAKIQAFLSSLGDLKSPTPTVPAATGAVAVPALSPSELRARDVLILIVEDADRAGTPGERQALLRDFLAKSAPFLKAHPNQERIWVLRAVAALELNEEKTAKRAGQKLQELGYDKSPDEKARKLMAMLDRKGWLIPAVTAVAKTGDWPEPGKPFENTLGMKFVPVPGTEVLFSIWDTRVQDYQEFVKATHMDWIQTDGPTYPAANVSWLDAKAFCEWLTAKEQQAGRLGQDQEYRLPTDAEWSIAVGLPAEVGNSPSDKHQKIQDVYPWGNQWPPTKGAGNYPDVSRYKKYRRQSWMDSDDYIHNYDDGFADLAPVGSFPANRFGLYDMGGNVLQWCEDWYDEDHKYRVLRGASFRIYDRSDFLLSSNRSVLTPDVRDVGLGFRCVVGVTSLGP